MTPRRKILLSLVFSLLVIAISGCGSLFQSRGLRLTGSSNFSQEVKEFEPADKNYSKLPFSQLIYLCGAYAGLKNYQSLFPCIDAAQIKVNAGEHSADLWDYSSLPLRLKATAYIELGRYGEAIKAAESSYAIIVNKNLERWDQVETLEILGMAYGLAGKSGKAEAAIGKLKRILYSGSLGSLEDSINIALARIYISLHRYQEAINVLSYKFEDSNTLVKTITGWDVFMSDKIHFEFMKNKCFLEVGRVSEAKEGYDTLLRYPFIRNQGEIYWNILFDLGRIAEQEGKDKEAIYFYTQAIEIIEQQRASINTEASKIGFVGDKQALYHNLIRVLYRDRQYGKAFEYVERSKSRALVDLLASKKDFAVRGNNEKEIKSALAMNDAADAVAIIQDRSIDKNKCRSVQVMAREVLQSKAPELASLVTVTFQSLAELQSLIPPEEDLIEYYYRDKDMYAFVLSNGRLQVVSLDSEGLTEEIQKFRELIESRSTRFIDTSKKLYKRLFQPLEKYLNKHSIIIVSHGALHYLPMNALHDDNGYLIDRYSIRMMPSASALKYLRERNTEKSGPVLIFGNPDLGDPRYDLEYAQQEALEIANIRHQSRVFIRKEATEKALFMYCNSYPYIHFATHSQFNPEVPLQSALLLAPDSHYNGLLTVDKLYSLTMNADLVTLSACETGLSKISNGDDLVGLTRGFLYAGCSSIVASLWKVDDLATAYLMTRFYKGLDKANKREALRSAQLETRAKYPHPYYWASFQLTGNAE